MHTQHRSSFEHAEVIEQSKPSPLIHPIEKKEPMKKKTFYIALGSVFLILILAGVGTGYLLAQPGGGSLSIGGQMLSTGGGGKIFGSSDTKTFTDTAVGTIEKEGISGEGTHKLIREGGPSQTACLVSSVLDLDQFVGKKVKVLSKTMAAKKCPWLMDVGRIELQ